MNIVPFLFIFIIQNVVGPPVDKKKEKKANETEAKEDPADWVSSPVQNKRAGAKIYCLNSVDL